MGNCSEVSTVTRLLLALDFGGTKLTAATYRPGDETWERHQRLLTPTPGSYGDDWRLMVGLAERVLAGRKPAGIGVSFGGPANTTTGRVYLSHHVPGWEDVPLARQLSDTFGAPTRIDNDAAIAALGEHRRGAGRGAQHLFYVTVSTGVGGGWILNGRPWRGAQGLAGEIGHTVVDPNGPRCLCGKRGCVERFASGPYMADNARAALAANPAAGAILRRLVDGDVAAIDGWAIAAAAGQGDELARDVLLRGARALGVGLGHAVNLVNPERIVLGGGVTKSGQLWWDAVRRAAWATALPEFAFEIVPAALGDDAPLWGAAELAAEAAE